MAQYVRYTLGSTASYGILAGSEIRQIRGDLFGGCDETGERSSVAEVKLLSPCQPGKILAVGLNYRSHLGGRPQPDRPEIFYKPASALQNPGDPIVIPRDATDVHYEGELVVVVGQPTRNATPEKARCGIFGVTCGNDVSERNWQHGAGKDLQWWRAKGCDTFAPLGPVISTGVDYSRLWLETRLNGEVVRIPMMSISHSDLMPIRAERSDAGLSQCETVIDIRQ
jgi:2-keto-4-pentenoate hydratase/2-oxohepta-3-ene-1,7-dioic acid hydratase in catechol pathway